MRMYSRSRERAAAHSLSAKVQPALRSITALVLASLRSVACGSFETIFSLARIYAELAVPRGRVDVRLTFASPFNAELAGVP